MIEKIEKLRYEDSKEFMEYRIAAKDKELDTFNSLLDEINWLGYGLQTDESVKPRVAELLEDILKRFDDKRSGKERIIKNHKQDGNWILVPVDDLIQPKDCHICMVNRWWVVNDDNEVLFYKTYNHPQCNTNEAIARNIAKTTYVKFIEMAYVPQSFVE
jgi:ribosomal protein L17